MIRPGACALMIALLAALAPAQDSDRDERVRLLETARRTLDADRSGDAHASVRDLLARALALDPTDSDGGFALAQRFLRRLSDHLDTENGLPYLEMLRGLYPHDDSYYRLATAELLAASARSVEAIAELDVLCGEEPGNVRARLRLAELHELRGDLDQALAVCEAEPAGAGAADLFLRRARLRWRRDGDEAATRADLSRARMAIADEAEARRARLRADLDDLARHIESHLARRTSLRDHDRRLDRTLISVSAAWLLVLGGGFLWLRRTGWLA